MKIRNGFVSNSSSSSFCIYGWSCKNWDEKEKLWDKLSSYKPILKTFTYSVTPIEGEYVVGVGHTASDMDHYMDDWEDYECKSPDKELCDELDKLANKIKLEPPTMYSETWYD